MLLLVGVHMGPHILLDARGADGMREVCSGTLIDILLDLLSEVFLITDFLHWEQMGIKLSKVLTWLLKPSMLSATRKRFQISSVPIGFFRKSSTPAFRAPSRFAPYLF